MGELGVREAGRLLVHRRRHVDLFASQLERAERACVPLGIELVDRKELPVEPDELGVRRIFGVGLEGRVAGEAELGFARGAREGAGLARSASGPGVQNTDSASMTTSVSA